MSRTSHAVIHWIETRLTARNEGATKLINDLAKNGDEETVCYSPLRFLGVTSVSHRGMEPWPYCDPTRGSISPELGQWNIWSSGNDFAKENQERSVHKSVIHSLHFDVAKMRSKELAKDVWNSSQRLSYIARRT